MTIAVASVGFSPGRIVGEALVVALLNLVIGALLGALVDNGLGAWTQLLTRVGQSRQRRAAQSRTQPGSVGNRAPPYWGGASGGALPLRATTTSADFRAQDRAPLSWTNERADTLFVCEGERKAAASKRDPRERSEPSNIARAGPQSKLTSSQPEVMNW